MCKKLQAELDLGGDLARQLVEHLLAMGAAWCMIPVEIDSRRYQVRVAEAEATEEPEDADERPDLTPEQFQREYMGTWCIEGYRPDGAPAMTADRCSNCLHWVQRHRRTGDCRRTYVNVTDSLTPSRHEQRYAGTRGKDTCWQHEPKRGTTVTTGTVSE